jgi:hypothetical protein
VQIASDIRRFIRSSPAGRTPPRKALGCSHPINRAYVIRQARPRRRYLITDKQHSAPPRAVLRLLSAPLQSTPAAKRRRAPPRTARQGRWASRTPSYLHYVLENKRELKVSPWAKPISLCHGSYAVSLKVPS